MKTILLLRHGKSDWGTPAPDRERPLAKRGRKAAARVGRFLARAGELPDVVVTSPALRARETVERAMRRGAWERPVSVRDALYEASTGTVLAEIRELDDRLGRVLLAGHEPTGSELLVELCGGGRVRLPTASVARIDVDVDRWSEVGPGRAQLVWLLTPRLLRRP